MFSVVVLWCFFKRQFYFCTLLSLIKPHTQLTLQWHREKKSKVMNTNQDKKHLKGPSLSGKVQVHEQMV